jgi:hypothetical protein
LVEWQDSFVGHCRIVKTMRAVKIAIAGDAVRLRSLRNGE